MTVQWPWPTPAPGMYFGMSDDEYFEIPCLNASAFKHLYASPQTFWTQSWMNPHRVRRTSEESKAMRDGKVYHKLLLEGAERFRECYAPAYEDDGDPDMVRTSEDLREALRCIAAPSSFPTKMVGAEKLLSYKPDARILDIERRDHEALFAGREFVSQDLLDSAVRIASRINADETVRAFFQGGYPEVVIIFDDDELGARFKIRCDYLKIRQITDFKTFANPRQGRVTEEAERAVRTRDMQRQAWLYLRGVNTIKAMLTSSGNTQPDVIVMPGAQPVPDEWLRDFAMAPCGYFWFVFGEKTSGDVVVPGFSTEDDGFMEGTKREIKDLVQDFLDYYDKFGVNEWNTPIKPWIMDYQSIFD